MNGKTITKIILDIVMTGLFLILIDPKNTGMTFHEIAGLAIGALFAFHIILNWSWVKNVTRNLFNPKLKTKPKLFYILNMISFIAVCIIIVTGIEISKVLFVSQSTIGNYTLVLVHKWAAYFCLGLFGVHITLHWRFIIEAIRKMVIAIKALKASKVAVSGAAIVLAVGLLYSLVASGASNDADTSLNKRELPVPRNDSYSQTTIAQENTISTSNGQVYDYPIQESASSISSSTSTTQTQTNTNTNSVSSGTSDSGDTITLAEYLGKMFCTGCSKHCSLLTPQCSIGAQKAQAAKIEYQQLYSTTTVN